MTSDCGCNELGRFEKASMQEDANTSEQARNLRTLEATRDVRVCSPDDATDCSVHWPMARAAKVEVWRALLVI